MKKIIILFLLVVWAFSSCTPFLDVVPDNTKTIDDMFRTKAAAYNALAKAYSYLPSISHPHNSTWPLGDEYIGRIDQDYFNNGFLYASKIMRGLASPDVPILDDWVGYNGGTQMYRAINSCSIFLDHINQPVDMTEDEKISWAAQVKFLKAYYNFLLIQKYGPIVIMDQQVSPTATSAEKFKDRQKIDSCFNYVINLMNEAIPNLKPQIVGPDLGQIDQIGATAIKARVMLFRASPFYNGNRDYYEKFLDHDGQPFFPMEYKPEKWKDAIDACDEALAIATAAGKDLFTYDLGIYYGKDKEDILINEDAIKKLYDLRMLIVTPWNKELLWGYSNVSYGSAMGQACNIRLPADFAAESGGDANSASNSWNWMGATYAMAERYYTHNGLPIDEDLTFDRNKIYDLVNLPPVEDPLYQQYAGILQPGFQTINLYLNREPRFYANLGITGGYWRGHLIRIPTVMYDNRYGGRNLAVNNIDFFCTGIGIQKFVHPESTSGTDNRQVRFPYPIIRLADLYLMKAEALNEYQGPSQEVYDLINLVRRRAGIPDVEVSWAAGGIARTPDKHKTKEGLRDIILQERSIELAFEGSHFWDMLRYKRAPSEFSSPAWGWDYTGIDASTFFVLQPRMLRKFTITSCLWPIPRSEINVNSKLIQNPGWQ